MMSFLTHLFTPLSLQFVRVFPGYTPNFIPKCAVVVLTVPAVIVTAFLATAMSTDVRIFYEVCLEH